ncbi:MAG: alpha/beta fold hydrolase [Vulcanimicrobiaceae bacterium]
MSTLLCLHGAGCTNQVFEEQRAAFPDLVALNLPGHQSPDAPTSIEQFADGVEALVTQAGFRAVVLCGSSMGGAIALELSLRAPGWLRATVLIGSGSRLRVAPQILERLESDFDGVCAELAAAFFAEPTPQRVALATTLLHAIGPAQTKRDFLACNAFDVTARLPEIRVPLLALVGEQDLMTPPKYAHQLAARVPAARAEVIAGAGHLAMLERPCEVNDLLRAFVTEIKD